MTTVQQYKESLQKVFKSDFCGSDIFIKEVLSPLFKEIEPIDEDDMLSRPDYAEYRTYGLRRVKKVAQINDLFDDINIFDITLEDNVVISVARVYIQNFVRSVAQVYAHAFLLFHYENVENREWRFSYMYKDGTVNSITTAKRFTYLFGQNIACRTAIERFLLLLDKKIEKNNLLDAFSVEALSNEFFRGYKAHYEKFCQYLYDNCKDTSKFGELFGQCGDKSLRDYVKKMLGRLVFIQFLHRKKWAPNLLAAYNNHPELQDNFLDAYLEPLFGGILNTPKEHRLNEFRRNVKRGWDESLIKEFESVPYLNGGLFESDIQDPPRSTFPKDYFFNLFQFFEQYNFTIDENESDDAEIGIDPEMLGKIFENLLEDNKDKGTFYTPKEIVQYMCRECLVQYLKNNIVERYHIAVENLIKKRKVDFAIQPKDIAREIYSLLENVKVCDPAIGSGVFPMGMLNELYNARLLMYGFTKPNKDFVHYDVKKNIIENNIYGVDIERGAIDIARLRFWLSLLIAEKKPVPLPNFDYKFMRGNSLLENIEGVDLSGIYDSMQANQPVKIIFNDESLAKESFERNMKEYFNTNDSEQKSIIRQRINNAAKALVKAKTNGNTSLHAILNDINCADTDKFFLWHTWFADIFESNGGFDIVIGNPPYIDSETMTKVMPEIREKYSRLFETAKGNWDIYVLFFEKGMNMLNTEGCLSFITPNKWLSIGYGKALRDLFFANLYALCDCQKIKVFEAGNEPVISTFCRIEKNNIEVSRFIKHNEYTVVQSVNKQDIKDNNLGMCISEYFPIISKLMRIDTKIQDFINVENPFSTAEAYQLIPLIKDTQNAGYKLINTGTIDPYINLWGIKTTAYLKNKYTNPVVYKNEFATVFPKRLRQVSSPKIIITGMRYFECYYDDKGEYIAGKSTIILLSPHGETNFKFLLGVLNSHLISFYIKGAYSSLGIGGGINFSKDMVSNLPIPSTTKLHQAPIIALVDKILAIKKTNPQADTSELEREIDKLVYKLYNLTSDEISIIESENKA